MYDFVIIDYTPAEDGDGVAYTLVVEKRKLDGNRLPLLDEWLDRLEEIDNFTVGEIIQELEAIPYGAAEVAAYGRAGEITIKQKAGK